MSLPECQQQDASQCRFGPMERFSTAMYCPLVFDREGKAVGGGGNVITSYLKCQKCQKIWICKQSDLETAQGKPQEWTEISNPDPVEQFIVRDK